MSNKGWLPGIIIAEGKFLKLISSNRNQQFPYNQAISTVVV
ncbi:hypothetical protein [Bacillus thuringiensis]